MSKLPVELSAEALDEARAAQSWYRERSDRIASRFVDQLERALLLIGDNPSIGPRWDHPGAEERTRRLPLQRFPFAPDLKAAMREEHVGGAVPSLGVLDLERFALVGQDFARPSRWISTPSRQVDPP